MGLEQACGSPPCRGTRCLAAHPSDESTVASSEDLAGEAGKLALTAAGLPRLPEAHQSYTAMAAAGTPLADAKSFRGEDRAAFGMMQARDLPADVCRGEVSIRCEDHAAFGMTQARDLPADSCRGEVSAVAPRWQELPRPPETEEDAKQRAAAPLAPNELPRPPEVSVHDNKCWADMDSEEESDQPARFVPEDELRERNELEKMVIDALQRYGVRCTHGELKTSSSEQLQGMLVSAQDKSVQDKLDEQDKPVNKGIDAVRRAGVRCTSEELNSRSVGQIAVQRMLDRGRNSSQSARRSAR